MQDSRCNVWRKTPCQRNALWTCPNTLLFTGGCFRAWEFWSLGAAPYKMAVVWTNLACSNGCWYLVFCGQVGDYFFKWEFWGGNSEILWWFFMWLFKYLPPPIFKKMLIDDFPAGMEQVSCVRITAWYSLKFYLMLHFIHTSSWYSLHFSQGLFPSFLQLIRLISFLTYHQVSHHGNVCMCQDMCNMLKGTE